jgi:hypothetical protein
VFVLSVVTESPETVRMEPPVTVEITPPGSVTMVLAVVVDTAGPGTVRTEPWVIVETTVPETVTTVFVLIVVAEAPGTVTVELPETVETAPPGRVTIVLAVVVVKASPDSVNTEPCVTVETAPPGTVTTVIELNVVTAPPGSVRTTFLVKVETSPPETVRIEFVPTVKVLVEPWVTVESLSIVEVTRRSAVVVESNTGCVESDVDVWMVVLVMTTVDTSGSTVVVTVNVSTVVVVGTEVINVIVLVDVTVEPSVTVIVTNLVLVLVTELTYDVRTTETAVVEVVPPWTETETAPTVTMFNNEFVTTMICVVKNSPFPWVTVAVFWVVVVKLSTSVLCVEIDSAVLVETCVSVEKIFCVKIVKGPKSVVVVNDKSPRMVRVDVVVTTATLLTVERTLGMILACSTKAGSSGSGALRASTSLTRGGASFEGGFTVLKTVLYAGFRVMVEAYSVTTEAIGAVAVTVMVTLTTSMTVLMKAPAACVPWTESSPSANRKTGASEVKRHEQALLRLSSGRVMIVVDKDVDRETITDVATSVITSVITLRGESVGIAYLCERCFRSQKLTL